MMKKSLYTTVICILLSIVLCVVSTASAPAVTLTAFIDSNLKSVMEKAAADDLIPVDIWLTEIDVEEVEKQVFAETGVSKQMISVCIYPRK